MQFARQRPAATVCPRMASPITSATAPELALRHIVATCRDDLLKHRTIVLTSGRPVGIHQTRVALRRMRAAFSLLDRKSTRLNSSHT